MPGRDESMASAPSGDDAYVLRLYVTGSSPRSTWAIRMVRRLCDEHLEGRCDLEVIDICQQPALARGARLVAAPTLVKELPLPAQRFVGSMVDFVVQVRVAEHGGGR
jgi:circadian clock protein KaiB